MKTDPQKPLSRGVLGLVVGPAGAGKTTVGDILEHEYGMHRVITATTRQPRKLPGGKQEVDGKDYYFVTKNEFLRMKRKKQLLESAQVHTNGDWYGTPVSSVIPFLEQGHLLFAAVDIQGCISFKDHECELLKNSVRSVFITVPGKNRAEQEKELRRRLEGRGEHPNKIKMRLATALWELNRISVCERIIVNHDSKVHETARAVHAYFANGHWSD